MTRAGVLLTAVLAAASVGVFAQDSPQSASAPPQDGNQSTQAETSRSQTVTQSASPSDSNAARPAAPNTRPAQSRDNKVPNGTQSASGNDIPAQQLPQTSTILPLLGLIGLGSLVAGLFARR